MVPSPAGVMPSSLQTLQPLILSHHHIPFLEKSFCPNHAATVILLYPKTAKHIAPVSTLTKGGRATDANAKEIVPHISVPSNTAIPLGPVHHSHRQQQRPLLKVSGRRIYRSRRRQQDILQNLLAINQ